MRLWLLHGLLTNRLLLLRSYVHFRVWLRPLRLRLLDWLRWRWLAEVALGLALIGLSRYGHIRSAGRVGVEARADVRNALRVLRLVADVRGLGWILLSRVLLNWILLSWVLLAPIESAGIVLRRVRLALIRLAPIRLLAEVAGCGYVRPTLRASTEW